MGPQGLPQDRVAKVKPFWASVSQDDRLKLLSIPLSKLKQRAAEVGARQRKEQGGQAASQYHFVCLLDWSGGAAPWTSPSSGRQAVEQGGPAALWTGTLCGPGASSSFPLTAI